MKRKMIGAAAAYLAGLFFASFFTDIKYAAVLLVILILLIAKGMRGKDLIMLVFCFSAAIGSYKAYERLYYERVVSLAGTAGDFEGRILEIESYSGDLSLYTLKGELNGISGVKINYFGSGLDAEYGDILRLENCKFSNYSNDYVFRNRDIFMAEGIFLSADYPENVTLERTHSNHVKNALMNYREKMLSRFRSRMDGETGNFLGAMVFGEKRGLDSDMQTSLYRCGIGHVMAVSGLHVSVIAVVLMTFFSRLIPGRFFSFFLMNLAMLLFITMAEWPVSAVRAAIMIDFAYSASLFRRQNDSFNSLAGAVLILCITNPYVIYSSGFLLSITASFGIGVFGPYMADNFSGRKFIKNAVIMICTNVCVFPLSMKYFGETSLIAPVINLLLLPFCSAALVGGAIYVMTGGFLPILKLIEFMLNPVLAVSDFISRSNLSYFYFSGKYSFVIIIFAAAAVIAVHFVFNKRALTAAVIALVFGAVLICSAISSMIAYNCIRIAFLGRGSSAAAVISYKGNTRIFDLSGYYNTPVYVRKYLCENGISRADSIVLTENEPSQYSAYISEIKPMTIGEWYVGDDMFVYNAENIFEFSGEIVFDYDDVYIFYRDESLVIDIDGESIIVSPADKGKGFVVSGTAMDHEIFIDRTENSGINNFEITLSVNGGYEFRRL